MRRPLTCRLRIHHWYVVARLVFGYDRRLCLDCRLDQRRDDKTGRWS